MLFNAKMFSTKHWFQNNWHPYNSYFMMPALERIREYALLRITESPSVMCNNAGDTLEGPLLHAQNF